MGTFGFIKAWWLSPVSSLLLHKRTDPYVKINLFYQGQRQDKWKSSVKRNTLSPVFNEPFSFYVGKLTPAKVLLEIVVMDHDR